MTFREFYLQRQQAEWPVTLRVLEALPEGQLGYKPHERSPSAEQLVWTLAGEFQVCVNVVTTRKGEWSEKPAPSLTEMRTTFERASKELGEALARMDDAAWEQTAEFYYQGKLTSEQPIGQFLWMVLFDAIHHRGQLSAYLRPMGGKVPAIYGPSADASS